MRKFRATVHIQNVDQGGESTADVQLGMFEAEKIDDLVAKANGFAALLAVKETAIQMHERLVAKQNEADDAGPPSN